jgi:hypothetical protein
MKDVYAAVWPKNNTGMLKIFLIVCKKKLRVIISVPCQGQCVLFRTLRTQSPDPSQKAPRKILKVP